MKTRINQLARKAALIISMIVIGLNFNHLSAQPENNQDSCEILLIGSSYFNYNNLADIIKNLADSSDIEIYIEMYGANGMYLSDHASSTYTEAKINERDWDYVVLQGVGVLVAYPEHFTDHPVYPALETLRDKIYANCESTHMMYCLPWAFEDGMTWYQNWTDTYEDMQIHIYNNTLQYSQEIGFEIAPVGWAWYGVLNEYSYPLHYLHMSDWNHPSFNGSYLMACVIYSSMFQESTVGNLYYGGIQQDTAAFFQTVASDTVLNNLELWNIIPMVSVEERHLTQSNIHLAQNHPNPFNTTTTIKYFLPEKLHVKLEILDSTGRIVTILIDEQKLPGDYEVQFEANGLSCGTYLCRLITESQSRTIVIVLE